jgi:hypothetical protein
MSAKEILPVTATVLAFPVQFSCPTCSRPCGEDELSDCLRCGQRYCSHDDWTCQCDRDAAEILSRAKEKQ